MHIDVSEELTKILHAWGSKNKRWPDGMPVAPSDAARWWIDLQEPAGTGDTPYHVQMRGKDAGTAMFFPYIERMVHNLRVFLTSDKHLQELVVAAREDGIFWRGGPLDRFAAVIEETERMRKVGIEQYRREAMRGLSRVRAS